MNLLHTKQDHSWAKQPVVSMYVCLSQRGLTCVHVVEESKKPKSPKSPGCLAQVILGGMKLIILLTYIKGVHQVTFQV